jgi:hypothetical protein
MKTMYHTEGVFSFWKGILPPLFVETPKRAWKVGDLFKTLTWKKLLSIGFLKIGCFFIEVVQPRLLNQDQVID